MSHFEHQIKSGDYEFIKETLEGTAGDAVEAHRKLKAAWSGGGGLSQKEMADYMQKALKGYKGPEMVDFWERMNPQQQSDIRALRNALERKPLEDKEIV